MSTLCINKLYTGIIDKDNKLDFFSRTIDIAVIESEILASPEYTDSHVINLDGINIELASFMNLFFKDGKTFNINSTEINSPNMSLLHRTIEDKSFNLMESILHLYSIDLKIKTNLMDPTSIIDITTQMDAYKSLGNFCSINCSLSFEQIIESIIHKTYNNLTEWKQVIGASDSPAYHVFVINIRLYNSNSSVKDIILKFNYIVECKGEDILKNIIESNDQYSSIVLPTDQE
jgi:hypothetical protein